MAVDALIAPLLRVRLFQGLKPLQITEIARRAEKVVYRDGQVITRTGEDADAAVLLVGGPAVCVDDSTGHESTVEPGSLIGEMGMLIEHAYGATVIARGQVKALRITRAAMQEQMLDDQALAQHFVARISARLSAVADDLRRVDAGLAHHASPALDALAHMPAQVAAPVPAARFPSLAAH